MSAEPTDDNRFRKYQEKLELETLSAFATKSSESRGRVRYEAEDPVRTVFQRDRDRILHSKAFRRLKHKTQVFIDPEEDHYRTRLTHTLEVAQIARTLARGLRLNEDLTEAITLAHDLGHTPFGHVGEQAIDDVLREYVPTGTFRHYEQSLRIVEVVEKDGRGLNLTAEVRDGILGHSKGGKDIGITDVDNLPATLEGMCVRLADRIAYINHDIDDAMRAGVLVLSDLPSDSLHTLGTSHSQRIGTMVVNVLESSFGKPDVMMTGDVVEATNKLKDFMYANVYSMKTRGNLELHKAQFMIKELFHLYMKDDEAYQTAFGLGSDEIASLNVEQRARRVTDFVSGMTDRYASMKFKQNFMPSVWSN